MSDGDRTHGKKAFLGFRKKLLGSTALAAVVAVGIAIGVGHYPSAMAADIVIDDTNDDAAGADAIATAAANDDLTVQTETADAAVVHQAASINFTDAGNIIVQHLQADDAANVTFTVTGNVATLGALSVINTEDTNATVSAVNTNFNGTTAVTLTTDITTAGAGDGVHSATLTLTGDATLTGAVTLNTTGAGNAGSDATLNLAGTTIIATAGITLNDDTAQSIVNINGAGAQTITGTIVGAAAGEGTLNITDSTADTAADLDVSHPVPWTQVCLMRRA